MGAHVTDRCFSSADKLNFYFFTLLFDKFLGFYAYTLIGNDNSKFIGDGMRQSLFGGF